ncbi:hypothetical protein BHM03_00058104, partial [Ensete ventricosum]
VTVEGQQDTKNSTLISSVRTLTDSKLGVISIGDQPLWNSTGVPPSLVFCLMATNNCSIDDEKSEEYKLFIGLLHPNS